MFNNLLTALKFTGSTDDPLILLLNGKTTKRNTSTGNFLVHFPRMSIIVKREKGQVDLLSLNGTCSLTSTQLANNCYQA